MLIFINKQTFIFVLTVSQLLKHSDLPPTTGEGQSTFTGGEGVAPPPVPLPAGYSPVRYSFWIHYLYIYWDFYRFSYLYSILFVHFDSYSYTKVRTYIYVVQYKNLHVRVRVHVRVYSTLTRYVEYYWVRVFLI